MARGKDKNAKALSTKSSKGKASAKPTKQPEQTSPALPLELQQKCLDLFRNTLRPEHQSSTLLQEVKGHLYNRDFAQAFGKSDYLNIYASRWSPSRALGYMHILSDISGHILSSKPPPAADGPAHFRICCIGGGAGAELVAIAAWLSQHQANLPIVSIHCTLTLLDIATWDMIASTLYEAVSTPPELSKYASTAVRESNKALVEPKLYQSSFIQKDALEMDEGTIQNTFGDAELVTLMFTLNELYSTSIPKTQQMLARLTSAVRPGSHMLVVDSPGSYSAVSVNGTEKQYPMQWLLDYTLVGAGQKRKDGGEPSWEKIVSDDSRWFRFPQGLSYPMELENMRYQIHLYKRLGDAG